MAEKNAGNVAVSVWGGVGTGVFWYVWGVYGFWWAVLYGMFAPVWIGFRVAAYLIGPGQ